MPHAGRVAPGRPPNFRRTAPLLLALVLAACGPAGGGRQSAPSEAPQTEASATGPDDLEARLGRETYEELRDDGEIIASSSLYGALNPIASRIGRAARPRYDRPFRFILVHEPDANAFSVPGGNIYVTDSLMYFVRNTEELAGVLCHEAAHTIHHDSMNQTLENMRITAAQVAATLLLDPSLGERIAIDLLGDSRSNKYSRDLESRADLAGAEICAAAGYNPYGMVWLFEDFSYEDPNEGPEILSDHPAMQARVRTLQAHFRSRPETYGAFSPDRRGAAALAVPKDSRMVLLQPSE